MTSGANYFVIFIESFLWLIQSEEFERESSGSAAGFVSDGIRRTLLMFCTEWLPGRIASDELIA
jgi:hypothetical protein